jgi:23S rRNA pseudouridine1911/1915/1917 synthase
LQSTLLHQVRRYAPDATAVHRLGRWTSGVVLFARNRSARAELSRQLKERELDKRYRALACGDPSWDALAIDRPIGPVPHAGLGDIHGACSDGKPSLSTVAVLERRSASFLCDVTIATGRPHQIRIHLAAVGTSPRGRSALRRGRGARSRMLGITRRSRVPASRGRSVAPSSAHGHELVVSCPPPPVLSPLPCTTPRRTLLP